MKTFKRLILFTLIFLVGFGAGSGGYHIHVLAREYAEGKDRWMICKLAHKGALYERANLYRQNVGRWPTNITELVEHHFLPEWSEVHACPSQGGFQMRKVYQGSEFVEDNHTNCVAYFTSSPYRFSIQGTNFSVICGFDKHHN